ncbi:MAG: hypothetical protein FJ206_11865 [Gemmatimonadetes bacterium]|nr:hypothetical protein [Gemmatimonadota bacterium]
MTKSWWWLMAAAVAGCGPSASRRAESVPAEPLPDGADTLVVGWAQIPEAAWLGGQRWVLVGADHDVVAVADFGAKTVQPLGGAKNPEIGKPYGVFTIGDTAFVADWGKSRLSIWTGAGQLVGSVPAPAGTRGILPKGRDAAGQYYFEIPPIAGPDGSGLRDSSLLIRSNSTLTEFDTIAGLAPFDVAEITEQRGKRFERMIFSGNDWWGVRPDGMLWIARVRRNEVSHFVGGKEKRGERLPDPVLDVTRADREQYVNTFPEELRPMAEKLPFAPFKANFERGFGTPEGLIWLRKSKAAVDSVRRYQVVDTEGRLRRVFTAVGAGVIVAASAESALWAEQFRGGVRLMELRLPAPPAAAVP